MNQDPNHQSSPIVPLLFGITDLDRLIDPYGHGSADSASYNEDPWQATLVGPDGAGKSILALHLASYYATLSYPASKVVYVSTDLSYSQALRTWDDFHLGHPADRQAVLKEHYPFSPTDGPTLKDKELHLNAKDGELHLKAVQPDEDDGLKALVDDGSSNPWVHFVDLQKSTTGDDWSFLNKLIGLLPNPVSKKTGKDYNKHLLIIDAVEGLETVVGGRDSFGQRRSRRSRIAQLIRTCMSRQCVHLAMIIEEPSRGKKLPEQFVADMVLRVRQNRVDDYLMRTIEIEKCRGVAHVRGQHEFHIRTGRGTRTGKGVNRDDPIVLAPNSKRPMSHIKIVPTLHYWNRFIREDSAELRPTRGEPTFGVDQLDRYFRRQNPLEQKPEKPQDKKKSEINGPSASMTLLLGDAGTYKSRLGRSFLAHGFHQSRDPDHFARAVLISTGWDDENWLRERLIEHLDQKKGLSIKDRAQCRRISIRHLTGAHFLEVVESAIHHAQLDVLVDLALNNEQKWQALGLIEEFPSDVRSKKKMRKCAKDAVIEKYFKRASVKSKDRWKESARIRVVIDDWSLLLASHPTLATDPLVLQSLLALLRREGVSSLIISTQPGQPLVPTLQLDAQDLRKLDLGQIYTWNVPFFGQKRTAITVLSSGGNLHPEVLELRAKAAGTERIDIDPHFALYAGLEEGSPRRIPLVVRLYMGEHSKDVPALNTPSFPRIMQHTLTQLFPSAPNSDVVRFEGFQQYDDFFTFTDWLDDSRIDHTLVFQIDEFWSSGKPSLLNLHDYWETPIGVRTTKENPWVPLGEGDPYAVYIPTSSQLEESTAPTPLPNVTAKYANATGRVKKGSFFLSLEDGGPREDIERDGTRRIDRVPFLWDFGMILARRDLWKRCADLEIEVSEISLQSSNSPKRRSVRTVWNSLCLKEDRMGSEEDWDKEDSPVTWTEFLAACRIVSSHNSVGGFGVDLQTAESLSSLLLEIWGSMDRQVSRKADEQGSSSPFERLAKRVANESMTLRKLIEERPISLFLACCQLVSACSHLQAKYRQIDPHSSDGIFAARREWYSTSASIMRGDESHAYSALSLPGTFATRGDWSLAVAKGSRSELLAHRALDLLCSRQMNIVRLHDGLGLPTRDVAPEKNAGRLQSALTRFREGTNEREYLWYESICLLGQYPDDFKRKRSERRRKSKQGFTWLWRSQIKFYQRDCFFLRRWISRLIEERWQWFDFSYGTRKGWSILMEFFQARFSNNSKHPWTQESMEKELRDDLLNFERDDKQKIYKNSVKSVDLSIAKRFLTHFDEFCQKRNLLAAVLDDEMTATNEKDKVGGQNEAPDN